MNVARNDWLGEVFFVHGSIGSRIDPEARKELAFHPGGMMLELGCHLIDVLVAILGRPVQVTPVLRHDSAFDDGPADNTLAVFHYQRAVAMIESAAMESEGFQRRRLEICGTEGTIVAEPIEPAGPWRINHDSSGFFGALPKCGNMGELGQYEGCGASRRS